MSHDEVLQLYTGAVDAYGIKAIEGQFEAWKGTLQQFSRGQLDAAIRRWQGDTTVDEFTGKTRGSRLPAPSDLKASILDFERTQASIASGKFRPCGKNGCEGGFIPVGTSITEKIDTRRRTSCPCRLEYIRVKKGFAA